MKILRQLCAAFALTLTLTLSAFAGEIDTGYASPPPSQQSTTQATTDGQMDTGIAGQIDTPFQAVLNLLQGVLSLI